MAAIEDPEIFRQFADALPVGAYIVDTRRKILFWNRASERITGYLSQEILGRACCEGVLEHCLGNGPAVCETANCPIRCALRDDKTAEGNFYLLHKKGHRVPVRVQAIPLRDQHGTIVAIAQLFQDESAASKGFLWDVGLHLSRDFGIPAASETEEQLRLHLAQSPNRLAVFMIAVEQLHEMERKRGAAMVRAVLFAVAQTITRMLTVPHYLGSWSDHRFLLLVPNSDQEFFQQLLASLKGVTSSCGVVWWGDRIVPQVSVRGAFSEELQSAEALLNSLEAGSAKANSTVGDV